MRAREHPIPPDLQPFVALLWSLESEITSTTFVERILPDGVAEAVFHFARPCEQRFRDDVMSTQPRSFVVSMTQRLLDLQPGDPRDVGFVAVRFHPGGFASFVDVPQIHLADRLVAARDLWGGEIDEVEQRLAAARDPLRRFEAVITFLRGQLRRHRRADIGAAVRPLVEARGRTSVRALAAALGCSERRLQRAFLDQVGMSPKHFARLIRFHEACRLLRRTPMPLAEIAVECGYFDQAHLVHEVRAFAAETPLQLRARADVAAP